VLRMSISLKGEIEFETSRLPLTSDLESRLFGLSRVRGVHPDEVWTKRGERSVFRTGTSGSMSGDGKRSGAEWPTLPRPSSTLPKLPIRNVRAVANRGRPDTARTAQYG
jgi:hypothetical protein